MNIEFKNGDKSLRLEFGKQNCIGIIGPSGLMTIMLTDDQIKSLSVAMNQWIDINEPPPSVGTKEQTEQIIEANKTVLLRNKEEYRRIWNAAIEAAAAVSEINSAADIRKLKK